MSLLHQDVPFSHLLSPAPVETELEQLPEWPSQYPGPAPPIADTGEICVVMKLPGGTAGIRGHACLLCSALYDTN